MTYSKWKAKYGGLEASDVKAIEGTGTLEQLAQTAVCGSVVGECGSEWHFCNKALGPLASGRSSSIR